MDEPTEQAQRLWDEHAANYDRQMRFFSSAPSWASSSGSWRAGPCRHGGESGCDEEASAAG